MAEPLSAADRSSLAAEQGPVNMAVGGMLVFERSPKLTREAIVERIAQRIHLVPRLRQRIEAPAMGLANPVWVDDHDFDLDWHVRHALLSAPAGHTELGAFVGREAARRLDRSRPLWELTVVDGMAEGLVGVLLRIHHALVDGVGAIALGALLLDPTPEPLEIPPPASSWEPQPFALRRHFSQLATRPIGQAQRLMFEAANRALDPDPRRAAGELRGATELLTELARNRPQAPMTPLNDKLTPNRRYALAQADLGAIKAAARDAGGTVNDALLAIVAGMLRRYLAAAGSGEPRHDQRPVALVPVSVRRSAEEGDLGNRISTVLVDLPVDEADPIARIRAVNAEMAELKASPAVRAGALMVGAAGAAPPIVSAMLARALGGVRAFNLVVSNIPGPQQPLYFDGARLLAAYPVVPLNPVNQRLNVGILSYDGGVSFGMLADAALDPPVSVAAQALEEALAELVG
jgi:diacylglycerol O-acyltransferase / wax synthase